MANVGCTSPGCQQKVVVRVHPVWKRRLVHQALYCEEHAQVFWRTITHNNWQAKDRRQRWGDAAGFDIELVLCDDRPGKPCRSFPCGRSAGIAVWTAELASLRRQRSTGN